MFRIALVNMPFAGVHLPSIALTQLESVLSRTLNGGTATKVLYLNHDFAGHFGANAYKRISNSVQATESGFGDWLFRQVAFPHLDDNADEYLQRYAWLLEALDYAKRLTGLAERIPETGAADLENELSGLLDRGLLFEENGRYISLVVGSGREEGSL
ncbi:MAG TPA: hypothetical protein VMN36_08375 [Verrucomicrobiales bacterium]|nr:hypothetical protein [Verrucomicrobiales bacterium]